MAYIFVVLYGIIYTLLNRFDNKYILIFGLITFLLIIYYTLKNKDKLELVGINKSFIFNAKSILNYLPVFLVIIVNLVFNISLFNQKLYLDILLLTLITATFEELFFRGYLLNITYFKVKGAYISSALFSILHIGSIENTGSIFYIISGLIFAFILGLSFSFYYLRDKNIFILIFYHFLINVSSIYMDDMSVIGIGLSLISSIIVLIYSYIYFHKVYK